MTFLPFLCYLVVLSSVYCNCLPFIFRNLRNVKNLNFSSLQLDVTSAQLLVTDNDFRDKDFRRQLNETVKSLLSLRVIPIFNENDAVSTRKAPYEVTFSCCKYLFHLF